jgi:hypothetical protein
MGRSPNGEQKRVPFITPNRSNATKVKHVNQTHSYVVSENGELVKVTGESYEYTGMFVLE